MQAKPTTTMILAIFLMSATAGLAQNPKDESVGPIMSLPGHTGAVMCIAFSPNGKFAATHGGLGDHSYHLWDVERRSEIVGAKSAHEDCNGLAVLWADEGRQLLTGGDGGRGYGSVILQDPRTGKRLSEVLRHELVVRGIALSNDGKLFAAADTQGLVVIRTFKGGAAQKPPFAHGVAVNSVAFSADGQFLISGSDDKKLRLWSMKQGRLERTFEGHEAAVSCVAFSKDGKQAYSATSSALGDTDNTIRIWDVESGKDVAKLVVGGEARQLTTTAFSPDGRRALTGHENGEVCLWDLTTRKNLATFRKHKHRISSVAFSPVGDLALSGEDCQGGSEMWLYRLPRP